MAKRQPPRENPRGDRSPFDKRRSDRFDDCGPMPIEMQEILCKALATIVPGAGGKTAYDLVVERLMGQAAIGEPWAIKLALRYLRLNGPLIVDRELAEAEREGFGMALKLRRLKAGQPE